MNEHDSSGTSLKGVRMKLIFLAVAMLVAASSLAFGQTSRNNTSRTGNDEQAIRQFVNDVAAALSRNDAATLWSAPLVLTGDTEVRRQVLATDDRRIEALRRGDVAPLRQIYADDYTLVTPAGVIRSKADQINDLASGQIRYEKIEVTERTVRVYGDVAIVLSREKSSILLAGQQVGGDMRLTRTYKKFGTEWRVIATHGSFVRQ